MDGFWGYHSEWNLGSPGGWDYQRITQEIGKAVWARVNQLTPIGIDIDFDHPLLYPIDGFVRMLVANHQLLSGRNAGLIAVIAEEETLEDAGQAQVHEHHEDSHRGQPEMPFTQLAAVPATSQ